MTQTKGYARTTNPMIEAVIHQLWRFQNPEDAVVRLHSIREGFIVSKEQPEFNGIPCVKLWIHGFGLTEEEVAQRYIGNYALIRPGVLPDGTYTLVAEKIHSELKHHPQRKRPQNKNANWGHPFLKRVKKGFRYATVEEAQEALQRFHAEFPSTTIPGVGRLLAIIYTKGEIPPIKKFVLELAAHAEGGVVITMKENIKKQSPRRTLPGAPAAATAPADAAAGAEETAAPGYYASMVAVKRAKKRRTNPRAEAAAARKEADTANPAGE